MEIPIGIKISDTEYKIPISEILEIKSIISQYKNYFRDKVINVKEEYLTIIVCSN